MIAVSLPDDLLAKLDDVVAKTGKKRSYLIRESRIQLRSAIPD